SDQRPAGGGAPAGGDGGGQRQEDAAGSKDASRELARLLGTADGARTARALQRAGMLRLPAPVLRLPAAPGGGAGGTARDAGEVSGAPTRPRPISIWQPRGAGAELVFVRPEPLPLGDHFAARRELRPKRAPLPLRVCLFGESAAAGYLYAPHVTPAGVLEAQLRAVAGDGAAEVIDLARTNETMGSLAATVESAVQIQPDVLVVFAGNNWNLLETPEVSPYAPSVAARQRYAESWRRGGPSGMAGHAGGPTVASGPAGTGPIASAGPGGPAEHDRSSGPAGPVALAAERLREIAAAAFERIALIARAIGVPVVLVVPEVSLAGWESRQPLAWMPGEGGAGRQRRARQPALARWYRLLASGRRQLGRGAWAAAARSARKMLDLDGGGNPTSWRLLARARMGAGDERAAAAAARAEIDAAAYPALAFLGAPQATSLAMDLLRQAARRHGFACVDLPEVFAGHTGSPLPGRRMFLDYCHLTAEGIEVAMAAVACEVLHLAGMGPAGELGWRELLRRLPPLQVPGNVEAVARLGAAVHGSHRLLPVSAKAPLLESWCDAALAASPGVESAMLDLVAARAAPLPAVLTAAQRHNLDSEHRLGLAHGWRWDHVDADLIEAIVASLERHGRPAAGAEADALLLARRGIREAGTDLLAPPYYLWEPLERFYPEVMSFDDVARRATLRSPWPETGFCLVCDGERDVALEITARLPLPPTPTPGERQHRGPGRGRSAARGTSTARGRRLLLSVNGNPAAALPLGETWSRAAARLPRHFLWRGRNRLTLHWPFPVASPDDALADALARLDEGIAADLHPVFGELYSVVAAPS
ncbi:MAG: hypothetical protein JOZ15_13885, partial [Acidobacteria bacterium]|nr:hypothetical protein [Acidobacteriota bacterium]